MKRFLFLGFIFFFFSEVARAWVAEWIYPLEKNPFWHYPVEKSFFWQPAYTHPAEAIQRIKLARRLAPRDPRYPYQAARVYEKAISGDLLTSALRKDLPRVIQEFGEAIRTKPIFPEYLIEYAVLLLWLAKKEGDLKDFLSTEDPLSFIDQKVEQALRLNPQRHAVRVFAATYYQYRGWREQSFKLWQSVLEENPSQTGEALERYFRFYQEPSFLLEIIPQKKLESLVRFQEILTSFRTEGWSEKFYLTTLPFFIERVKQGEADERLFEIIGRTYREAGEPALAYSWYEKAFQAAKTPEALVSRLLDLFDLLIRQDRFFEAKELLKTHLGLSSIKGELLVHYANLSWRLGERQEAIEVLRKAVALKGAQPEWLDQLASFLYEEGRFEEARLEWQSLLGETRGSAFEKAHKERIFQRIKECERKGRGTTLARIDWGEA